MSAKPWHRRWHGNALNGMRGLTLELRGAYQTLLDLMYDHGGPIRLDERRLCGELDCDMRVFRRVVGSLIAARKIRLWLDGPTAWIVNDKVLVELKMDDFHHESSAELTPDLRDKFAIANPELSPNSRRKANKNNEPENGSAKKTRSRERERGIPPKVPQGDGPDLARQAFDLWNETAERCDLPKAEELSETRRKSISKRLESGGLDRWRAALLAVERNKFCRGLEPGKDFKAHLDFVCRASQFQRLIEGTYRANIEAPKAKAGPASPADPAERWRRPLRSFQASGYWNTLDDGPKPGKPGCEVPATILAEFGLAPLEVGADVVPFPTDRSAA